MNRFAPPLDHFVRESSSEEERLLAKEKVAGSSPVSRSKISFVFSQGKIAKVVTAPV